MYCIAVLALVCALNTAYLAAFTTPSVFYMANARLHAVLDFLLAVVVVWKIRRLLPRTSRVLLGIAAPLGVYLSPRGSVRGHGWICGRISFLRRQYQRAVEILQRVPVIDPEDVQAHYNLMLAYKGAGDTKQAAPAEKLFPGFKADESAQTITARTRLLSPETNNERQMIHYHETGALR
jgi:hypothetical protein